MVKFFDICSETPYIRGEVSKNSTQSIFGLLITVQKHAFYTIQSCSNTQKAKSMIGMLNVLLILIGNQLKEFEFRNKSKLVYFIDNFVDLCLHFIV